MFRMAAAGDSWPINQGQNLIDSIRKAPRSLLDSPRSASGSSVLDYRYANVWIRVQSSGTEIATRTNGVPRGAKVNRSAVFVPILVAVLVVAGLGPLRMVLHDPITRNGKKPPRTTWSFVAARRFAILAESGVRAMPG